MSFRECLRIFPPLREVKLCQDSLMLSLAAKCNVEMKGSNNDIFSSTSVNCMSEAVMSGSVVAVNLML